jgi:hypothetical protein
MLQGSSLPKGALQQVGSVWIARVEDARQCVPAAKLYQGRGLSESSAAAGMLGGDLYIVSAGLGVVRSDTPVPAYSITVTDRSPDNVLLRVSMGMLPTPAQWWSVVSRLSPVGTGIAELVRRASPQLVLMALPSTYLAMIADDLNGVHGRSLRRVRIFSRALPATFPERLRPLVMPYDERLDGPDSPVQGTRADFASRALRHFADHVLVGDPRGSLDAHKQAVTKLLKGWREQAVHSRHRHSDEDLVALIRRHWHAARGLSSRMLRILRDDLGVACEQGRFIRLFATARVSVEARP